jgi:putative glutamine amidotransferase
MRPAIGITISYDDRRPGFFSLRGDYVRSIEQAGGVPLILAPGRPEDAAELLQRLDGLLLSGGSDVDPALYGEAPHPRLGRVIRERDLFELALVREALRRDLPLLAVCRGHQVLNVACSGTLVQDIPSQVARGGAHDAPLERWERAHEVAVRRGTRLHAILGKDSVAVNSFHHQAIEKPGAGLAVSAVSEPDGVIEGIEAPAHRFVVGVQWHPEGFWRDADGFQPLFDAFVQAGAR